MILSLLIVSSLAVGSLPPPAPPDASSLQLVVVGNTVTATWTMPLLNDDGTSISGPTTYTLYRGPKGKPMKATRTGIKQLKVTYTRIKGWPCIGISTTVAGVEGETSSQACEQ